MVNKAVWSLRDPERAASNGDQGSNVTAESDVQLLATVQVTPGGEDHRKYTRISASGFVFF